MKGMRVCVCGSAECGSAWVGFSLVTVMGTIS